MKRIFVSLFMGLINLCLIANANAQEFRQHISKEFTLSKAENSILYIYNLNGSIKVEGYNGNQVLIETDLRISAEDDKTLELGKKEFKLTFEQKSDTVMAYISEPFDSRPHHNWHYSDDRPENEYNYNVDYSIKVPFAMNLHISTVNEGIISISDVKGKLHVSNVNAEITIKNALATTYAHTVNGDVTINYLKNPTEESSYYTINGNIHVSYQPDLSADLQFKSMHGDFYTDFPDAELLPPSITKIKEKKDGGIVYKLNAKTSVRFGKGGKIFKFETLNGNVYIKKQS
jgi:hypothetical protein